MGFFKRLFDSASDSIKKSVEERKQELLKSVEERKQEFLQNVEDRKNEALAKIGLKSENSDNSHKSEGSKPSNSIRPDKSTILPENNKNVSKIYNTEIMEHEIQPQSFSAKLETLIKSALKDGILTDKEREIIKIIKEAIDTNNKDNTSSNEITDGEGAVIYLNGEKRPLSKAMTSIELYAFRNQTNIERIILPSNIQEIGTYAFEKCSLLSVDFSQCKELKKIGDNAFYGTKIKEMIIADSVEVIGPNSFDYCDNLKTIVMPAALKEIKPRLGDYMEQLKKIDFSKVRNLKTIPKEFVGFGCDKLKELVIPQGVVEIEDDAFAELDNLKRLFLPPTLESIGDLEHKRLSIYCFSPLLEELEPIVYGWDDDDDDADDDDDRDEEDLEELEDKKKMKINLFVLPQYLDKYIAQRNAERIPEDILVIDVIPEEYRYYYDN
jgi:hypothetical protein